MEPFCSSHVFLTADHKIRLHDRCLTGGKETNATSMAPGAAADTIVDIRGSVNDNDDVATIYTMMIPPSPSFIHSRRVPRTRY